MKRVGNLWPEVVAFPNLLQAARQAQKGKRFRENVLQFNYNLEGELLQLRDELRSQTYTPGPYRTFEIKEPKPRMISAAPYRDRVVHHALCNVIVPIFERTFVAESFANRWGYGTHRALRRFIQFARHYPYVLQCDISKYFPSIDHAILKQRIRRKLKCRDTLWLIDQIIDASNEQIPALFHFPGDDLLAPLSRRRGLPIGNLTSQFFANLYLNGFDHFVKQDLGIAPYVRYVDDFALFAHDQAPLATARSAIEEHLAGLRLRIHPIKSQIFATQHGATFLGFRILPNQIRVRQENLRRGRRRLRRLHRRYVAGRVSLDQVQQSLQSWQAHLHHGDTWQLQQQLFSSLAWARG